MGQKKWVKISFSLFYLNKSSQRKTLLKRTKHNGEAVTIHILRSPACHPLRNKFIFVEGQIFIYTDCMISFSANNVILKIFQQN